MFDLPPELVEEILSRVPAIPLKRLRSTCKRWDALCKDQRFTEKHFRKAPKQPPVIMLKEDRLVPTKVDLNVVPPSIKFERALDINDPHSKNSKLVHIITEVFHCDGLLLCITKDSTPLVWNPCLGETRWIHHQNGTGWQYKNGCDRVCNFALGYVNNQSCRGYKILMFWESSYAREDDQVDEVEIYELSSNSWRVVNAPNSVRLRASGVTLKGNTYWPSDGHYEDEYILSFDFTRERFRPLCFPQSQNRAYDALSVVREEKLSVLQWSMNSSIQIWVTKEIDITEADLSWSKSFAVDLLHTRDHSVRVFTCLLIDEEKKVALCCTYGGLENVLALFTIGEEDEYYTKIPVRGGPWSWPFLFNYVPSLVKIQQDIESHEVTTSGIESAQGIFRDRLVKPS